MPAVSANVSECVQALLEQLLSQQTPSPCSNNSTSAPSERSESRALLYIVVTLLFYSGGIIIGIITYLKRERREIEEDRAFDEFINTYIEPETRTTFHKVQQVIARLKYLQEEKVRKMGSKGTDVKSISNDNEDKTDNADQNERVDNSLIKTANSWNETENTRLDNAFCEDDEPLSSIVAKLIDPEKRRSFDVDSDEEDDYREGGLTKTPSMQSIKDYTEEPGRSARSSLIDDDNEMDDDSSTLINNERLGNKEDVHCKTVNKGCIVTNV
ncbi:uncharacterized protein LOC110448703 [Mizuhopecten yessoensis]|uniref:Uncharacterized protein n=1 Tax=Mizuhopecten yessoensis TaxID=6573 RepID=A0A210QSQ5_MIZYE|nr:uncharacterized protein LOC110448703 [Mizuhopecten yessoensis]XP_021350764.1 uncharacterized protein LOC110448703 [Mizuhopecten yessoensis]OWF51738.1 hypothetical protein KP79_PYT08235 [Mizuhopecten yessoensis]